jgi:hypothetical protein
VSSEWYPVQTGSLSPSNSSTRASHHVSKHHKSGEDKFKTKTKTVTEDCTASDDVESSTAVETVSFTTVPKTTTVTKIRIDLVTTKSLHKPKHTKHHWTETEVETETETIESPTPTSSEFPETHTKHHKSKSKHHSKHHTKHNTTEIVETPVPTSVESSSQSSSDTSMQEVVVVTTEQVEVVTTGIEEVVSTITLSEGDSRLSTLTTASSTESSTVAPWRTNDPFFTPMFPPLFVSPHLPPFISTQLPNSFWSETESVTDDSTTRTGHKTKEPPSINTVGTPSSSSTTDVEYPLITTAPKFLPTEMFITDELVETLVARDNGDPDKKRDKYLKPNKAMSKRMSRWSKHHSHAEEKNWSRHLKHGVKSLEDRIEYDNKHSKKHKTTLAAALPAMETPAAAIEPRGDHGDPEKKYRKKMSIADKIYSKYESLADSKYEKQYSKEMKKSSKAREKSLAKERQSEEKAFSKELKSRIKNQKEEDGYGGLAAREVMSTPKKNVAKPTATVTVIQTVGGGNYNGTGTLSTSWRTKYASKTASLSTTVGGGN